ncbi:TRAP transporter small permease [Aurantimonas sp. C2-6-R+9]|uniref:TRAP transporter small permease n=1 Tax=unclassified Aurantimonas TaxID=2638230 RepID=UPI002E17AF61|nr:MULTISPECIES: TRAP transporter small permease [unclassified Aurantimonas]MEC5292425.1 TRAP transporter small permease [Aurantimonas sp. C2-3-R2]MEC5382986.1 TRAP transporter small permease [Aurantimonas sp. C2-6-R+9]MEC5413493.1 TRAP transporter small permease [Aurantimonas sp. C2-4-R8]
MTGEAAQGLPVTRREGPSGPSFPDRIIGVIHFLGCLACAVTLAFMFAALLTNVVLRYAFGSGITWAYEIHALLLPWLVAGGVIIAAARGRHIAVTLLPAMLQDKSRLAVLLAINLITLAIAASVVYTSRPILNASQFQSYSSLGIKQVWGYASIVVAFGGIALIAALDTIRLMMNGAAGLPDPSLNSLS